MLKLNIYEKREIVKTYTAEAYDLMMGTVEDLLEAIDLDLIQSGSDADLIKLVGGALLKAKTVIYPLLMDVFDGLTEEELRHVKAKEVVDAIIGIVKYSFEEIGKGATGKN